MTRNNPPVEPSQDREDGFWTFDAVEERLIEGMRLWWRSPGEGRWPFAGDAPWQLMTRKTRIEEGGFRGREYQLRLQAEDAEEAKRWEGKDRSGPLTRDDVARRDEATDWLSYVSADNRKVVILALVQRASGRTNIDWKRVKTRLHAEISNAGLFRRYSRSITAIANRLNSGNADDGTRQRRA